MQVRIGGDGAAASDGVLGNVTVVYGAHGLEMPADLEVGEVELALRDVLNSNDRLEAYVNGQRVGWDRRLAASDCLVLMKGWGRKGGEPLYSSHQGNNDELFALVIQFYFNEGDKIADVTYGKGVFWRKIEVGKYQLFKSDLLTCLDAPYNFRDLPYDDEEFHGVVFDPPYVHHPGRLMVDRNYRNAETTKGLSHREIIELYRQGMREAVRILKPGGLLLAKCQDEIESGRQQMSHIEIHDVAVHELGLTVKDLFVVTRKTKPVVQVKRQRHARKNHSYLWVFKK